MAQISIDEQAPLSTSQLTLSALGATVRAELAAIGHSAAKAVVHAMTLGDALNAAKQIVGHGNWASWVAAECGGLSLRTAQVYMQLASRRTAVEAVIAAHAAAPKAQRAAPLTVRGILRRIGAGKTARKQRPPSDLKITAWRNASADQRTAFFGRIPTAEIIGALTPVQRGEIESHLNGQIISLKAQVATLKKQVEMSVPIVRFKTKRAA